MYSHEAIANREMFQVTLSSLHEIYFSAFRFTTNHQNSSPPCRRVTPISGRPGGAPAKHNLNLSFVSVRQLSYSMPLFTALLPRSGPESEEK